MTPQTKAPATGQGQQGLNASLQNTSGFNYTTACDLRKAASSAFERELAIIMLAADRMAAGHGLAWDDYDRLHTAHQHVIGVLSAMRGMEVLQ
jgi:hypothetical protein